MLNKSDYIETIEFSSGGIFSKKYMSIKFSINYNDIDLKKIKIHVSSFDFIRESINNININNDEKEQLLQIIDGLKVDENDFVSYDNFILCLKNLKEKSGSDNDTNMFSYLIKIFQKFFDGFKNNIANLDEFTKSLEKYENNFINDKSYGIKHGF